MSQDRELEIRMQFLEETSDKLKTLASILVELTIQHTIPSEHLQTALRGMHSIKGGAGIMGFSIISDFAHNFEDALKLLKHNTIPGVNQQRFRELLLSGVSCLQQMVEVFATGEERISQQWVEADCQPIFQELQTYVSHGVINTPERGMCNHQSDIVNLFFQTEFAEKLEYLAALIATGEVELISEEVIAIATDFTGVAEILSLPNLAELCTLISEKMHGANFPSQCLQVAEFALSAWRKFPQNATSTTSKNTQKKSEPMVRVPIHHLEKIHHLFGEFSSQRCQLKLQIDNLHQLARNLNITIKALEQEQQGLFLAYENFAPKCSTKQKYISLEENYFPGSQKLSEFYLLSEQVVARMSAIKELASNIEYGLGNTEQVNRLLHKSVKKLQQSVSQMRMRPLSEVTAYFSPAIEKWCQQYGKNVQLQIIGGDILIERSLLDIIQESLMHLLHNAFDHGIEDITTRKKLGKSEQGLIVIHGFTDGNCTVIHFQDDGSGISLEKIRDRAINLGVDSYFVSQATETELLSLIFTPGFSTKEEITHLSGRGMGLDVVQSNLHKIGGNIQVETTPEKGTRFILSFPSSLAIARILLVESNNMLLALPKKSVVGVCLLNHGEIYSNQEFWQWQGQSLPLLHLDRHFTFNYLHPCAPSLDNPPKIDAPTVLILQQGEKIVALKVERCWSEQEVTIQQVEGSIPLPRAFSHCTILADGRVLPLVNVQGMGGE
ncbi:hypothetical protein IJ00_06355 [Calothrix sp. 336/3]|nr:hypothetical protein IJ00_06355 [Calothrix sp. 336/3]